jgi:predicted dehydrogenase
MRALIVGTGSIGQRHMANLRQLVPQVMFDVLRELPRSGDVTHLSHFGEKCCSVSTSLEQALGKKPQLMVIANPSAMHLPYLLAAIEKGIPFYAEKPVLTHATDLLVLRKAIQGKKLPPNVVGCNLRFLPSLQQLRQWVQGGHLGHVVRASFEAGQWLPDWRPAQDYRQSYSAQNALGGGVLLDLIHELDAARWLLGDFTSVQAQLYKGSNLEIETEDCACLLLRAQSGPLATVALDYVSRSPVRRYCVVGDQASAEWNLTHKTLTLIPSPNQATLSATCGTVSDPKAFDVPATYACAMQELLYAIDHNTQSTQPLQEGLAALDLVLRAKDYCANEKHSSSTVLS